jgi:putative acetyltransferase
MAPPIDPTRYGCLPAATSVKIRLERPEDAPAIRTLTDAAFKNVHHRAHTEARIVDALRSSGALTLSLVALDGSDIVGHAAFSPVRIDAAPGDWYGLGPVSVKPNRQRRGFGEALVRAGLHRLRSVGAAGCVVLGDPAYYSRFGFESSAALVYRDAPAGYFQWLAFGGPAPTGEVTYHPSFDVA